MGVLATGLLGLAAGVGGILLFVGMGFVLAWYFGDSPVRLWRKIDGLRRDAYRPEDRPTVQVRVTLGLMLYALFGLLLVSALLHR